MFQERIFNNAKIKDERLQLKNLKNIRIVYIVQTIGMILILGYDFINEGISGMTDNPLWFFANFNSCCLSIFIHVH